MIMEGGSIDRDAIHVAAVVTSRSPSVLACLLVTIVHQRRCRLANATPDPDFRYRSNTSARRSFYDHINDPRSPRDRMRTVARVVRVEAGTPIAGYTGVVTGSIRDASEHVHSTFGACHWSTSLQRKLRWQ